MNQKTANYDESWKEALTEYFEPFLCFFNKNLPKTSWHCWYCHLKYLTINLLEDFTPWKPRNWHPVTLLPSNGKIPLPSLVMAMRSLLLLTVGSTIPLRETTRSNPRRSRGEVICFFPTRSFPLLKSARRFSQGDRFLLLCDRRFVKWESATIRKLYFFLTKKPIDIVGTGI